jgi:hypothetical protein
MFRAHAVLQGNEIFVLVQSPSASETVVSLSERIGPAVLLTNPSFLERLTRPKTYGASLFETASVLVITGSNADVHSIDAFIRRGCCGILGLNSAPEIW